MGLKRQTPTATDKTSLSTSLKLRVPDEARILIVSDDDSDAERLKTIFRQAGFNSERARSMTVASEWTKSGRFQVVVSTPLLSDGSWRRLVDVASHHNLALVVILLARSFDLRQWAEALMDGAFDVLDALNDLPKAAEVAKRAWEAAELKRSRPHAKAASC
ncbi:MAG: hypothetical protein DMG29_17670 [Acidobacteria bacterium]|nr:MAG: hypothetical protein DMG29_17670 [Acidobacteriota bacterium]